MKKTQGQYLLKEILYSVKKLRGNSYSASNVSFYNHREEEDGGKDYLRVHPVVV